VLEVALTTLFIAVAVVTIGHRRQGSAVGPRGEVFQFSDDDGASDLPCPWCKAQTREDDHHCPACGQPFGPWAMSHEP
jgi:hypothetical protein